MPPPVPDQSAEAAKEQVRTISARLIRNIDNPAGMDPGQFLDDVGALDKMGRLEAPDPHGVLQPTEPLLFFRDVARASRGKLVPVFVERVKANRGNPEVLSKDLRLAHLLGLLTPEQYEENRKKFNVPEPPKPAAARVDDRPHESSQPSAEEAEDRELLELRGQADALMEQIASSEGISLDQVRETWKNETIPPQAELLRRVKTGSFADLMQAFLLAGRDMEDGQDRAAEVLSDYLSRLDISRADRERAVKNLGRPFVANKEFWNTVQRKVQLQFLIDWANKRLEASSFPEPAAVRVEAEPAAYNKPWQAVFGQGEIIGVGGDGHVYLVKKDGRQYAVKVFDKRDSGYYYERHALEKLQGTDHVARMVGYNDSFRYVVKEFIDAENMFGTFYRTIHRQPVHAGTIMSPEQKKIAQWFISSMEALAEIHGKKVLVSDFKFADYLWEADKGTTILIDFANALDMEDKDHYWGQKKPVHDINNLVCLFLFHEGGTVAGMRMGTSNEDALLPGTTTAGGYNQESLIILKGKVQEQGAVPSLIKIIEFVEDGAKMENRRNHSTEEYVQAMKDYFREVGLLAERKSTGPLTEAPTLLAQEDPFVNLTEAESLRKAEIFWAQNENNLLSHGQTREQVRMDFIAAGRRDLEGITGLVTKVEYRPAHHSPRGLGGWVPQRSDFAEAFPPNSGQWVKQPNVGDKLAIKVARQSGQAEGQITSERAVLLRLDGEFNEDFAVRPVKLRGYGVNENGRPYLALEWIGDDFQMLERYIEHNREVSKPLPEQTAVTISLLLSILLQKFHQADIVYNDFGNILANAFWDPKSRRIRIIDFGNAFNKSSPIDRMSGNFGDDREGLGQLLFRLTTGKRFPGYDKITPADWATMSPATRRVVEKACSLLPQGQNYDPQGKEATSEMLTDLNSVFNSLI